MLNERTAELLSLLIDAPEGEYLAELREGVHVLWRISEGEPQDGAMDPALAWALKELVLA